MFTPFEQRVLDDLAKRNGTTEQRIAGRLGYKPSCNGKLVVHQALHRIATKKPEILYRIPPKDEWGAAVWGICQYKVKES